MLLEVDFQYFTRIIGSHGLKSIPQFRMGLVLRFYSSPVGSQNSDVVFHYIKFLMPSIK